MDKMKEMYLVILMVTYLVMLMELLMVFQKVSMMVTYLVGLMDSSMVDPWVKMKTVKQKVMRMESLMVEMTEKC